MATQPSSRFLTDVVELLCQREIRSDVKVLPAYRNSVTGSALSLSEHTPGKEAVPLKTLLGQGRNTGLLDSDGDGSMDMREAMRSYEANLNMIENSRRMQERTLDLLRR